VRWLSAGGALLAAALAALLILGRNEPTPTQFDSLLGCLEQRFDDVHSGSQYLATALGRRPSEGTFLVDDATDNPLEVAIDRSPAEARSLATRLDANAGYRGNVVWDFSSAPGAAAVAEVSGCARSSES
jgi:hypothetical protein